MQFVTRNICDRIKKVMSQVQERESAWRAMIVDATNVKDDKRNHLSLELRIYFQAIDDCYLFVLDGVFCFVGRGLDAEELVDAKEIAMETVGVSANKVNVYDMSVEPQPVYDLFELYLRKYDIVADDADKKDLGYPLLEDVLLEMDPQILSQMAHLRKTRDKLHIMLVDDDPMSLAIIESVLKDVGHVAKYQNAFEALEDYCTYAPHIVFLDIQMPPYSGHDLLKRIKHVDEGAFVVMLSANAYPADIKQSIISGARGFVAKPFSKDKLLSYLDMYKRKALAIG